MKPIQFTVIGEAQPKGSTKMLPIGATAKRIRSGGFFVRSFKDLLGSVVVTSDNPKLKRWQTCVSYAANLALGGVALQLSGGINLQVVFYLPRPKSLPKSYAGPHVKKPDLDKCLRAINDALTGVLYIDDSQVRRIDGAKHYAAVGEAPRVVITVTPYELGPARPLLDERI